MYICIIDSLYISVRLDLKERTEKDSGRQHILQHTYRGDRSVSWAAINHTHTQKGHIEIVRERERETAIASTYAYDVMCSRLCLDMAIGGLIGAADAKREQFKSLLWVSHAHTRNYSDLCIYGYILVFEYILIYIITHRRSIIIIMNIYDFICIFWIDRSN